jgi:hypothetical protein
MFERFTDRARRVVVLAQEEARLLDHNYIGTEHLLLGLIHEEEGVAAQALTALDISLDAVRAQVEEIIGRGDTTPSGHIPFTPRAKKVLEMGLREALQLGHNYIGTEHILLGLIREGEGVAAQVLVNLGAELSRVRQQVIQLLSGYGGTQPRPATPRMSRPFGRGSGSRPPRCVLCGRREQVLALALVARAHLICDQCIRDANEQLRTLEDEHGPRRVARFRSRPVEGAVGDPDRDAIERAFGAVFGAEQQRPEDAARLIEDGTELADTVRAVRDAATRFPVFVNDVTVQGVNLVEGDEAEVDVAIWWAGMPDPTIVSGHAVKVDDSWLVANETFWQFAERAGVMRPQPGD